MLSPLANSASASSDDPYIFDKYPSQSKQAKSCRGQKISGRPQDIFLRNLEYSYV